LEKALCSSLAEPVRSQAAASSTLIACRPWLSASASRRSVTSSAAIGTGSSEVESRDSSRDSVSRSSSRSPMRCDCWRISRTIGAHSGLSSGSIMSR
jgi:hypothetical protein